jgi:Zn-dependent M28 family amino/carboxypeptidase
MGFGKQKQSILGLALLGAVMLFGCGGPAGDKGEDIRRFSIRAHLKFLADDLLEGRSPGSRGGDLAAKYIAAQFESFGLEPAVGDTSYFQPVQLVGMNPDPQLTFYTKTGRLRPAYRKDFVAWTQMERGSVQLPRSEVVFMGYGIVAPEYDWNDYEGVDVEGKVLLISPNEPPSEDENFFDGKALTYYGRWTYKFEEAARRGAVGVVLIHTTEKAGYGWQVVEGSWSGEQFYLGGQDASKQLRLESWITEELASRLLEDAGYSLADLLDQAGQRGFRPIPLNFQVESRISNTIRHIVSSNVVGRVPGGDLADEYILYTSHYDHIGLDPTKSGDNIFNGAVDNASGTAGLIELARAFSEAQPRPRRSILIAAVTAEEAGLLGSKWYAQHPVVPLEKTAANVNIDGLNVWGETKDIIPLGADRSTIWPVVERVAREMGMELSPDPMPEQGFFFRSDQFSLVKVGVPAVYFDAGQKYVGQPEDYGRKLAEDYIKNRYHRPSDEYNPAWTLEGAEQMVRFAFRTGYYLANLEEMPVWNEGEAFKRIRDEMLSKSNQSASEE